MANEHVKFAHGEGVTVVPSVNTFHYGMEMEASLRLGTANIRRLRPMGVAEFQIDSVYEPAFR